MPTPDFIDPTSQTGNRPGKHSHRRGDVHRYGFPRSDLQVADDRLTIRPSFALGGWAAFKPMGDTAMVMGDLVLLQTEINPVMSKLIEGGLEITAIHSSAEFRN